VISNIYYYKHPQFIWAQEIYKILTSGLIDGLSERQIIDAPCGDGVISFWLKKKLPNLSLDLYDLDESLIKIAQSYCGNVKTEVQSIFDLAIEGKNNVWLLVNSLYCLPDKDKLLDHLGPKVEYIIAVFPHIEHKNYRIFLAQNPGFANPNAMSQSMTIDFFLKHRFKNILKKDVTFIPPYAFKHIGLGGLTKRTLNVLDPLFKGMDGSYWLAVFARQ